MKKIIQKEVEFCDKCGRELDFCKSTCMNCGLTYCYNCSESGMVEYPHALHRSGGGDGCYCKKCDAVLTHAHDSALHNAYREMQKLREMEKTLYDGLHNQADDLENRISGLFKMYMEADAS